MAGVNRKLARRYRRHSRPVRLCPRQTGPQTVYLVLALAFTVENVVFPYDERVRYRVSGHQWVTKMTKNTAIVGPTSQQKTFRKLDGRGVLARQLRRIREELAEALGGDLSPQQNILLEGLAVRVLRCRMLTADMLNGGISAELERRLNWHLASVRRDLVAL